MENSTQLLLIINFETGDDTAKYYDVAAIIETAEHGSIYNICVDIADSLSSYFDNANLH